MLQRGKRAGDNGQQLRHGAQRSNLYSGGPQEHQDPRLDLGTAVNPRSVHELLSLFFQVLENSHMVRHHSEGELSSRALHLHLSLQASQFFETLQNLHSELTH